MKFLVTLSAVFLLSFIQRSLGCHNALHGRPSISGGNNPSSEDGLRVQLSGHGLPQDIINCVVNRMERKSSNSRTSRKKRSSLGNLGGLKFISEDNDPLAIEEECLGNGELCLNVLACAEERNVDILQLIFPTKVPPTTTTTTTTTPPLTLPLFLTKNPKFPDFPIPEVQKLPGFSDGISHFPECNHRCSGLICSLRCYRKRR